MALVVAVASTILKLFILKIKSGAFGLKLLSDMQSQHAPISCKSPKLCLSLPVTSECQNEAGEPRFEPYSLIMGSPEE